MSNRESRMPLHIAVLHFMRLGKQTTHCFNSRQAALYFGLQFEELAEKVAVVAGGALTPSEFERYASLHATLKTFAKEFKDGMHQGDLLRCQHNDLIDADFDLAWVSLGAIQSASSDPLGAVRHGTFTNLDKFRDGVAIVDENGKVQKPADWQKPDFTPYVDTSIRG